MVQKKEAGANPADTARTSTKNARGRNSRDAHTASEDALTVSGTATRSEEVTKTLNDVLSRLSDVQQIGLNNHWMARCPRHTEDKVWLRIKIVDGKDLCLVCDGGCDPSTILNALACDQAHAEGTAVIDAPEEIATTFEKDSVEPEADNPVLTVADGIQPSCEPEQPESDQPWEFAENDEYVETSEGLFWKKKKDGSMTRLSNFTARIVSEITQDDGVETSRLYSLAVRSEAEIVQIDVPAESFQSGEWMAELGSDFIVSAGAGLKDRIRHAVQSFSKDKSKGLVFAHTGWRKIGEQSVYLHAGGAIGADNVSVSLPDALSDYALPEPPEDPRPGIEAVKRLLELAPVVTYPLVAGVMRSVLGDIGTSLLLVGTTGAGKTTLAAMAQQFFGSGMHARNLPANWSSTATFLESTASQCKDAVLVIDEMVPYGTRAQRNELASKVNRILRGTANKAGRGRAGSDAKAKPEQRPRAFIIVTAEDVPEGQSLLARTVVLNVPADAMTRGAHRIHQKDGNDGLYAQGMAGYIAYLAPELDRHIEEHRARVTELVDSFDVPGSHRRTPENVAELLAAFERFTRYAVATGAITSEERDTLNAKCRQNLVTHLEEQVALQRFSDPIARFQDIIEEALATGRAHLKSREKAGVPEHPQMNGWRIGNFGSREPVGACIGYIDDDGVYLIPDAAYRLVSASRTGDGITLSKRTLWDRLRERGELVSWEASRQRKTVRVTVPDAGRIELLHLRDWRKEDSDTGMRPSLPAQPARSESGDAHVGTVLGDGRYIYSGEPSHMTVPQATGFTLNIGNDGTVGTVGTVNVATASEHDHGERTQTAELRNDVEDSAEYNAVPVRSGIGSSDVSSGVSLTVN